MKLGDMTVRQIAEICGRYKLCSGCQFNYDGVYCKIKGKLPCDQDLDMEVKTDAENQD